MLLFTIFTIAFSHTVWSFLKTIFSHNLIFILLLFSFNWFDSCSGWMFFASETEIPYLTAYWAEFETSLHFSSPCLPYLYFLTWSPCSFIIWTCLTSRELLFLHYRNLSSTLPATFSITWHHSLLIRASFWLTLFLTTYGLFLMLEPRLSRYVFFSLYLPIQWYSLSEFSLSSD